jgi:hypothetical protein
MEFALEISISKNTMVNPPKPEVNPPKPGVNPQNLG